MKKLFLFIIVLLIIGTIALYKLRINTKSIIPTIGRGNSETVQPISLDIRYMKSQKYPGSEITIEKNLPDGEGFHQYLTYYYSDGLKIFALLTIPSGLKPVNGWPVILFNHGYIAPQTYQTFPKSSQYASYYSVFAKNGYIVFKPDYRGNGTSEGIPSSAYYSPNYTIDDLNALASIKKYKDANPSKIGIWGHSMGGNITLKSLIINTNDIKAAIIWNGVVGSFEDLINNWQNKVRFVPNTEDLKLRNMNRQNLINQYGTPSQNPTFWNSIDPTNFLSEIQTPIQIDTTPTDEEVPYMFSQKLYDKLHSLGKTVELNVYPNDNHNLSKNFNQAMQDSLKFFDTYLKH